MTDHLKQATGSLGGDQIPEDLRKRYEYAVEQVRNMDAKSVLKKAYQQTYAQYRQESEDIERIAKAEAALAQKTRECEELRETLADANKVHTSILRGTIALTKAQAIHIAGLPADIEAQVEQLGRQVAEMSKPVTAEEWNGVWLELNRNGLERRLHVIANSLLTSRARTK